MCYAREFRASEAQKSAEAIRTAEDKRAETVNALMSEANRQAEQAKPEHAPAREAAPAK